MKTISSEEWNTAILNGIFKERWIEHHKDDSEDEEEEEGGGGEEMSFNLVSDIILRK
jgi:hypothetical protein